MKKGKALSVDGCLELDRQNGMAWAIHFKVLAESHGRSAEALKAAIHAVAELVEQNWSCSNLICSKQAESR